MQWTDDEIRNLTYIAEEMAGLVFDDDLMHRFVAGGLVERAADDWRLTDAGRMLLGQTPVENRAEPA